eukprot:4007901-Alexandrium_andersonii.AAC.1
MGGPASPLLWALAYDPIVVATADTARSPVPTYVDDLPAHVRGVAQALVLSYFLITASSVAGLLVKTHQCMGVVVSRGERTLRRFLAALPLHWPRDPEGRAVVRGLPGAVLQELAEAGRGGCGRGAPCCPVHLL